MLCGAYCIVLGGYANQKVFSIGFHDPELGDYILLLQSNVEPSQLLSQYLQKIDLEISEMVSHKLPFKELVEALEVEDDSSRNQLFQIVFNWNTKENEQLPDSSQSKYDLELAIHSTETKIQGQIRFYTKIFYSKTVEDFLESYINVLEKWAKNITTKMADELYVGEIGLTERQQQMLARWKCEQKLDYCCERTLPELFESVVEKYPSRTAIVCGEHTLTYRELNEHSNKLAHRIISEVIELLKCGIFLVRISKNLSRNNPLSLRFSIHGAFFGNKWRQEGSAASLIAQW